MTVGSSRTIGNSGDVSRKIPSSALSPRVLTELEGVVVEQIAGPDAIGAAPANVVVLSRPVVEVLAIFSTVTATGAAGAVLAPIPTTHWTLVGVNVGGVGELTNPSAVDFSAETWTVLYRAATEDETFGGQHTVS